MVEKYYNEQGEVAVLYSPGYGAGWYSWNTNHPDILFDKDIVQAVIDKDKTKAGLIALEKYPEICELGIDKIQIEWMQPGQMFQINCFDGYESIKYNYDRSWLTA